MTAKSYHLSVESFAVKLDPIEAARGIVRRARERGRDPHDAIEAVVESMLNRALEEVQPAVDDDGELLADVTTAVNALLAFEDVKDGTQT